MATVKFVIGEVVIESEWNESATARVLLEALPLEASGNYWGEELYFTVPVNVAVESGSTDVVEAGTVAYWPPGPALCLFWGPTPVSRGGECRAASAVSVVGRVVNVGDLRRLTGRRVRVELG